MPNTSRPMAEAPISPIYDFNEPGQSIMLHDGPIGGLAASDVAGVMELSCTSGLSFDWRVSPDAPPDFANHSELSLELHRSDGYMRVHGVPHGMSGGWSNGGTFGDREVPLKRIIAHWFNLPRWHGSIDLLADTDSGKPPRARDRWLHEVDGWRIRLDARPDHRGIWTDLHNSHVYVMTHVMELARADGGTFTATEAQRVLTALHVGVSFTLGRWAAPMLPVGVDASGNVAWEEWVSYHCDPARSISPGWWHERDSGPLAELLDHVIPAFTNPNRLASLRLQMMFAIAALSDRGFVEQRITMGTAGLEHIMWQLLVLDGHMAKDQYEGRQSYNGKRLRNHDRLRKVLTEACISVDVDPKLSPVTAKFVADEAAPDRQGKLLDGADVVTQIRNRLVHPKGAQEPVYRLDGLTTEVWLMTRHYLVLLILNSLGYRGPYRDLRQTRGWAGDVATVPWAYN